MTLPCIVYVYCLGLIVMFCGFYLGKNCHLTKSCAELLFFILLVLRLNLEVKVKQSCYRPGVAQRVPGS
jgi:hypothetical protein